MIQVPLVVGDRRHPEFQSQIDNRDHFAAKIDNAFHKIGGSWNGSDRHHADDLFYFQDADTVLFLIQ